MRFTAAKWFATVILSTAALAYASFSTKAEACCGLFGCRPRCCYGPVMRGCAPSGCGTTYYYGPVVWGRCSPCGTGCSPCGNSCSPCGPAGSAPCAGGDCALGSPAAGSTTSPAPNENWEKGGDGKKTFAPPEPGDAFGTGLGAPGDMPRKGSDGSSDQGANKPGQLQDDSTGDVFEKPTSAADEIKSDASKSSAAGSKSKVTNPGASKGSKKGPPAPRIKVEGEDPDSSRIPTVNVDEKVAWRTAPARQRIETRSHIAGARLSRLPAYPKSDWVPVDSESKIASK